MQDREYVFIIYEDDKLKLPMCVADSLSELARLTGFYYNELRNSYLENRHFNKKYKVEKIDIREPEEKFTFDEYKKFCKSEKLSVGSFSSLKKFAKYCYGEVCYS